MVVQSKLLAVVAATNKISLAAFITIMKTSTTGSVTVSLSFITRLFWSAASPSTIITTRAPLSCGGLNRKGFPKFNDCRRFLGGSRFQAWLRLFYKYACAGFKGVEKTFNSCRISLVSTGTVGGHITPKLVF